MTWTAQSVLKDIRDGELDEKIDEEIKDIVIRFNELGYTTITCCAGHDPEYVEPYIAFACRPEQLFNFADRFPYTLDVQTLKTNGGAWYFIYYPGDFGVTWWLRWMHPGTKPNWDIVRQVLDSMESNKR